MKLLFALVAALSATLLQAPAYHFQRETLRTPDGATLRYGRAIPDDYDPARPGTLVLALHPGGEKTPYYGDRYMQSLFLPGLSDLDPIMLAPDCPTRSWSDPAAEKAVMALMDSTLRQFSIDRRRILVVGYSLGGRGTWFMESRHSDLFTAAIVMAGSTDEPIERLAKIPTYIIHSRDDEVVPFGQAERRAVSLASMGRTVKFEALSDLGHFNMGSYAPALMRAGDWVAGRWPR